MQSTGYHPDNPKPMHFGVAEYPPVVVDEGTRLIIRSKSHAFEITLITTLIASTFVGFATWGMLRASLQPWHAIVGIFGCTAAIFGSTGTGIAYWRKRSRAANAGPRVVFDLHQRQVELASGARLPLQTLRAFECVKIVNDLPVEGSDTARFPIVHWDLVAVFERTDGLWYSKLWSTHGPPTSLAHRLARALTVPVHECRLDFREPSPTR